MKTAKNVRPANSIQQKSVRMRVYGQTVCILTLFLLSFHIQNRIGISLLIDSRTANHLKSHMLIKSDSLGIFFIDSHFLYGIPSHPICQELLSYAATACLCTDKKHFQFFYPPPP